MDKYLSIITNFGCHGKCPYCIVRENGIDVPKTTLDGLDNLLDVYKDNNCNIISLSGGGDPLHNLVKHLDYYIKLMDILESNNIPLELHTSYVSNIFATQKCKRVVYHLRDINDIDYIVRKGNEIIRVVFVVEEKYTENDLNKIYEKCMENYFVDELSFRQMVDSNYNTTYYNYEFLKQGHKDGKWHYIEQNDYNLYYVNGEVYTKFADIHK